MPYGVPKGERGWEERLAGGKNLHEKLSLSSRTPTPQKQASKKRVGERVGANYLSVTNRSMPVHGRRPPKGPNSAADTNSFSLIRCNMVTRCWVKGWGRGGRLFYLMLSHPPLILFPRKSLEPLRLCEARKRNSHPTSALVP